MMIVDLLYCWIAPAGHLFLLLRRGVVACWNRQGCRCPSWRGVFLCVAIFPVFLRGRLYSHICFVF